MKTISTLVGATLLFGFAAAYSCATEGRKAYCCASTIDRLSDLIVVGNDCTAGSCNSSDEDLTTVCGDVEIPSGKKVVVLSLATSASNKFKDL